MSLCAHALVYLCACVCVRAGVCVFSYVSVLVCAGSLLTSVELPASQVTSVCWGGKDLDELYVTSARINRPDVYFFEQEPLAGSVFRVKGLGVKGRPAFVYEG